MERAISRQDDQGAGVKKAEWYAVSVKETDVSDLVISAGSARNPEAPDVAGLGERLVMATGRTGICTVMARLDGGTVTEAVLEGGTVDVTKLDRRIMAHEGRTLSDKIHSEGLNVSDDDGCYGRFPRIPQMRFESESPLVNRKGMRLSIILPDGTPRGVSFDEDGYLRWDPEADWLEYNPQSADKLHGIIVHDPAVLSLMIGMEEMYRGVRFPAAHMKAMADVTLLMSALPGGNETQMFTLALNDGQCLTFFRTGFFMMPSVIWSSPGEAGRIPPEDALEVLKSAQADAFSRPVLKSLALLSPRVWWPASRLGFLTAEGHGGVTDADRFSLSMLEIACRNADPAELGPYGSFQQEILGLMRAGTLTSAEAVRRLETVWSNSGTGGKDMISSGWLKAGWLMTGRIRKEINRQNKEK